MCATVRSRFSAVLPVSDPSVERCRKSGRSAALHTKLPERVNASSSGASSSHNDSDHLAQVRPGQLGGSTPSRSRRGAQARDRIRAAASTLSIFLPRKAEPCCLRSPLVRKRAGEGARGLRAFAWLAMSLACSSSGPVVSRVRRYGSRSEPSYAFKWLPFRAVDGSGAAFAEHFSAHRHS